MMGITNLVVIQQKCSNLSDEGCTDPEKVQTALCCLHKILNRSLFKIDQNAPIVIIRLKSYKWEEYSPEYSFRYLKTRIVHKYFESFSLRTTIRMLKMSDVTGLPVKIPSQNELLHEKSFTESKLESRERFWKCKINFINLKCIGQKITFKGLKISTKLIKENFHEFKKN